jgi:hypothetical protein
MKGGAKGASAIARKYITDYLSKPESELRSMKKVKLLTWEV